jgi:spermidine/putrescine transport system substrate-binding protein
MKTRIPTELKRVITLFNMFLTSIPVIVLLSFAQSVHSDDTIPELVILNWSEYISPAIIDQFQKERKVKIREVYFESDDARDQILLQTGGKGFDLILVNGVAIDTYRKRGWLQAIPAKKISNLKHIDKRWTKAFESSRNYGVPYLWGTLGIAYRKDLVSKPITSWNDLYRPAKELQGKILMVKSSRDIIGMALKALGYSANSEDINELRQAEELVMAQKPFVAHYGYITLGEDSSLVKGTIVAATVYGGDALNVGEFNENIVYVLPSEGGNIWVDYFTISSSSRNPELAAAFINFINQPAIAAANTEELFLATPNTAAKKLLSKDILNNSVIYPDQALLEKSELYKELPPAATRTRASIFARIVR